MVSTHQQYLCPDYLSPLTSTPLDSNKSPLALLAQTCNSIGLPDTLPNPTTKSNKATASNGISVESTSLKNVQKEDAKGNKMSSQPDSTSDSVVESHVRQKNSSPSSIKKHFNDLSHRQSSMVTHDDDATHRASSVTSSANAKADAKASPQPVSVSSAPSTSKCCPPPAAPYPNFYSPYLPSTSTTSGFPFGSVNGLSLAACYPNYQATPSMSMFPRVCTDPYCKSCPPNPAMAANALAAAAYSSMRPCPMGCVQCTSASHPDLSMWLNSYSSLMAAGLHGLPNHSSMPGLMPGAYPSPQTMAMTNNPFVSSMYAGAQSGGHVCNWFSGEKYCGKVFTNAEELLQHLRGHTHETSNSSINNNKPQSTLSPSSAGRMSPRSTYLNTLHSLRYHPYKLSPSGAVGNAAAPTPTALPHLAAFSSLNPAYNLQTALLAAQRLPGSIPHP